MKKTLVPALILCCVLIVFFLLTYTQDTLFSPGRLEKAAFLQKLASLGESALQHGDIPISSLLVYNGEVIGEGYNTVLRDSNAAGHAEINAISDALKRVGVTQFTTLNRDSLVLLSTFEPCAMCRGAILEYKIRRVEYLMDKPAVHQIQEDVRYLLYQWRRVQKEPRALQDSLFRLHPHYKP